MHWFQLKTKFGRIKIIYSKKGIYKVEFKRNLQKIDKLYKVNAQLKDDLRRYFNSEKVDFKKYAIDYSGFTDFERKVLKDTKNIDYGNTIFYSQLAKNINLPLASRAVGNALGKNRVPVIIPCHRVIRKNGKTGGFSAGIKFKKILLSLEN